ncbi:MAG: ATPase [Clostridia bacterium]|nr:ATPase [Clostridia bacterium]
MNVEELLDKIDDMVDKALSVPLSRGKCLIDADELRDVLDDIRAHLPSEIRQAKAIVSDRNQIIDDAKNESESIIKDAERRRQAMIEETEVYRVAQEKATETINAARENAREMRNGARDFAEDLLKRTEEALVLNTSEVRQARQSLRTQPKIDISEE